MDAVITGANLLEQGEVIVERLKVLRAKADRLDDVQQAIRLLNDMYEKERVKYAPSYAGYVGERDILAARLDVLHTIQRVIDGGVYDN